MNKKLQFNTKANTLRQTSLYLKTAKIPQQICIKSNEWERQQEEILDKIEKEGWLTIPLIVRSSAQNEDTVTESLAGKYESIPNVYGRQEIINAVNFVLASYVNESKDNQVFIQAMLKNVKLCGVAFSVDPNNGGNYIVINYDDNTGFTDTVTSGKTKDLQTFYFFKGSNLNVKKPLNRIIELVRELEQLYDTNKIDLEFAIDENDELYLLQIRPLVLRVALPSIEEQKKLLERISTVVIKSKGPKPFLYGKRTIYGVMPDWNPAEMIGMRPRKLAISLYKNLITDYIWAYQRYSYGYKNLISHPLLIDLGGIPYIDVRVSFNSFLPLNLDKPLSEKLVDYYINELISNRQKHDKVEFDIVFSCFTFDLEERLQKLINCGFTQEEITKIFVALRELTKQIIDEKNGHLRKDIELIYKLDERREEILKSPLDKVEKIYWLLEDCKQFGTLPFAGLARGGFIAVQMLQSLKTKKILSEYEFINFMGELDTIGSQITRDFYNYDEESFIKKYGHLRPGTYDILSYRYDEDKGMYFDFLSKKEPIKTKKFLLSLSQLKQIEDLLVKYELNLDVLGLFDFFKFAIEAREISKFVFTKNLSNALTLLEQLGCQFGFTREDISYLDIEIIYKAYKCEEDINVLIKKSIQEGKERYQKTLQINLPTVLVEEKDVWAYYQQVCEPSYITLNKVSGTVVSLKEQKEEVENKIVFFESADPGYDWIFSKNIAGFVTMYGGPNSHMAIRAGELSIPAAIGIGENKYYQLLNAKMIEIDCEAKNIKIIR